MPGKGASSASNFNPLVSLNESGAIDNDDSERPVAGPKEGRSARSSEATSSPFLSVNSSECTSLTELVDLDRKYKNRFVAGWVHTRISLRLLLMLLIPFASLIILLVIVISGEAAASSNASKITVLANLAQDSLLLVAELSSEYTDCLWWILNRDLKLGITWTKGGVNGLGLSDQIARTDLRLDALVQFITTNSMYSVDSMLAVDLAVLQNDLSQIYAVRYKVETFRYSEGEITNYYLPLLDNLLDYVDRTATLADTATVEYAQALVSWSRTKTAYERERHTVGMILLQQNFTLAHYTDWNNILAVQSQWKTRFQAIAPNALLDTAVPFFNGDLVRTVREMRYQGL
eukprot:RCo042035